MDFILYSYFRSSASHRVRIALNLKGIGFEYRPVHLLKNGGEQHNDEYAKLNPAQEVPTLIHRGRALGQSLAIFDYLDHIQPEPALFPRDPYHRALNLQACEIVNSGLQPLINLRVLNELGKRYESDQQEKDKWACHWFSYGLGTLEAFLQRHAGDFCFGHEVTAADCFLLPQLVTADRFKFSLAPYPTLSRIRSNCEKLEPFMKSAPHLQPDTPQAT